MEKDILSGEKDGNVSDKKAQSADGNKKALAPHKEYAKRMSEFSEKFLMTLLATAVAMVMGIALSIYSHFLIGLAAAALGVIIYIKFVSSDMYSLLGIEYKTYEKGMKLTKCRARYGDVFWVPARLMFFDVVKIENKAFCNDHNAELRCVFLPKSLQAIGKDVFEGCDALEDIFFEGSREEWEKIEKLTDLSSLRITFDAKYPAIKKKSKKKKSKKKN